MKCREKREIQKGSMVRLKNGREAYQGVCPKCGTKITRMGNPDKKGKGEYALGGDITGGKRSRRSKSKSKGSKKSKSKGSRKSKGSKKSRKSRSHRSRKH